MPIFRSPAKINLFLKILGRRSDGFHELASLFQTLDLFDFLHIEKSDVDRFSCSDVSLPTDASNLVMKALALFRQKTGLQQPFHIHLEKHIPSEAGLGGGSGNAATTLWAINHLLDQPASEEELKTWTAEIGSDISFFFSSGTAYCTGRGECVQSLAPLPSQKVWLVKPIYGLSTPLVYQTLRADQLPLADPQALLQSFTSGAPRYVNDLEIPAFQLRPELAALKGHLQNFFGSVLMSGSGTSFFGLHPKPLFDEASHGAWPEAVFATAYASRGSAWY